MRLRIQRRDAEGETSTSRVANVDAKIAVAGDDGAAVGVVVCDVVVFAGA